MAAHDHAPGLIVVAAGGQAHGLDEGGDLLLLHWPVGERPKGPADRDGIDDVHMEGVCAEAHKSLSPDGARALP